MSVYGRKKVLNWESRHLELYKLINRHKAIVDIDCIVTASVGKNGSYVAHSLKSK
jgi:hypothetical protein